MSTTAGEVNLQILVISGPRAAYRCQLCDFVAKQRTPAMDAAHARRHSVGTSRHSPITPEPSSISRRKRTGSLAKRGEFPRSVAQYGASVASVDHGGFCMRTLAILGVLAATTIHPALAGDLQIPPLYKAPPVTAPPIWTGFYLGGHAGAGWAGGGGLTFSA